HRGMWFQEASGKGARVEGALPTWALRQNGMQNKRMAIAQKIPNPVFNGLFKVFLHRQTKGVIFAQGALKKGKGLLKVFCGFILLAEGLLNRRQFRQAQGKL